MIQQLSLHICHRFMDLRGKGSTAGWARACVRRAAKVRRESPAQVPRSHAVWQGLVHLLDGVCCSSRLLGRPGSSGHGACAAALLLPAAASAASRPPLPAAVGSLY